MSKHKKRSHTKKGINWTSQIHQKSQNEEGVSRGWKQNLSLGWRKAVKFWNFVWEDDSPTAWILSALFAFIIIKFMVYPAMGFALSTSHPVVAVVSGSMEHKIAPKDSFFGEKMTTDNGSLVYHICDHYVTYEDKMLDLSKRVGFDEFWEYCGSWYEERNITKSEFKDYPFADGFNTGDIIFLKGIEPEKIEEGDVIVFKTNMRAYPIIHRVVSKKSVQGQAQEIEGSGSEKYLFSTKGDHNEAQLTFEQNINSENIIGKGLFRIPFLGWIKIGFTNSVKFIISLF